MLRKISESCPVGSDKIIESSGILVAQHPKIKYNLIIQYSEFDVMILEKKLKQLQFKTSSYIDLGLKDVEQKILEFATTAPCDSLNVIYFSGHGGHSKGENYLYPVDFGINLDMGLSVDKSALNLNRIYPCFTKKVKLLIIVDACRDNLTPKYAGDFSEMVAPQNTYIAYATQFGDYSGCTAQVSYFTEALCENT